MARRVCVVLLALLASGCGGPTNSAPTINVALKPQAAAPVDAIDPWSVSVLAAASPPRLAIDGDIAEWGSLVPPPPAKTKPSSSHADKTKQSIANTASYAAVALSDHGADIALDLGESAREGVWLGIAGFGFEWPEIGEYKEIGGSYTEPQMGVVPKACAPRPDQTEPHDPETDPECIAFRKDRAALETADAKRFRRWYQIAADGVKSANADGSLAPVAGANVVFKPKGRGATAEVALPLLALPRFSEAPVVDLGLAVRTDVKSPPPAETFDQWVATKPPSPVAFEPFGALRALAFEGSSWMTYQPGDPTHVEVTRYPSFTDRSRLVVTQEPLFVSKAKLGNVEVGYLTLAAPPDVTVREGQSDRVALAIVAPSGVTSVPIIGEWVDIVPRDGNLHVLSYHSEESRSVYIVGTSSSFGHAFYAWWSGTLVGPDGQQQPISFDDDMHRSWDDVDKFFEADSLGVRGHIADWASGAQEDGLTGFMEFRWRWDAKKRSYVATRRVLSDTKPKPKKKAKPRP